MIKTEPIIAVKNVHESSEWYQKLLNCKSGHGGDTFEILTNDNNEQILSLHKWSAHEHPTLSNPNIKAGNGLILYFVVDDLNLIWKNAKKLNAKIEEEPHLNINSGRIEFSIRDLDDYFISICANKTN
ncbi:glyoxalase [Flavobacterium sp. 316]|uniref:VOC family protein n=1 Tax=Flavobacterium sp. 316 TaxID=1603293 RepID=UPI0005E47A96|nr:VOC family protein [Flavobacterium sp. 316]KIX22195.1 glyoxalase [Flavobacterium sp. 316]